MPKKSSKKKQSSKPVAVTRVKLRFVQHLLPPLFGVLVTLLVFGIFNSQLIAGRLAYGLNKPASTVAPVVISDSTKIDPSLPSRLYINKIGVEAPLVFGEATIDEAVFQKDLQKGVVHYPFTAMPGEGGNTVVFGHSSGQIWAPGDYKFVFTLLDKLVRGDHITIEHQGTRYTYEVTSTEVVLPSNVSALYPSTESKLTLITCTPVGTNEKRLIVEAKQISPVPNTVANSEPLATPKMPYTKVPLPGNSPSALETILQIF